MPRDLPSGVYEDLVTRSFAEAIAALEPRLIHKEQPDETQRPELLARHLFTLLTRVLSDAKSEKQADLVNSLLGLLREHGATLQDDIIEPLELLLQ